MKKHLFLTLALLLASFVGVNAQWSVTLTGVEGLPGNTATLDGVNVTVYKTGIITPDQPIKKLRFTVAGTRNNEAPNNNNFIFALSELNVYKKDATTEVAYTPSSNADFSALAQSFADGPGLPALNDGRYDKYFHSMWADGGKAVAEYHYIEMEFEEPLESFILEWAGRPNSTKNDPVIVGLTEGGVDFVPFTDRSFEVKDAVTALENLPQYVAVRGNASETYDIYRHTANNDGPAGVITVNDTVGSGPMYVTMGNTYAKEPSADYVTELIPTGNGTYYMYFPIQKRYLTKDSATCQFNNAGNGWQGTAVQEKNAAEITLTPLANGDFEMSYTMEGEVSSFEVYIGQDPRNGRMKTFTADRKAALEADGWCQGFGIKCAFNWTIFEAEYVAPAWTQDYVISQVYSNALDMQNLLGEVIDLSEAIALAEETLENIADMDDEEVVANCDEAIGIIHDALYDWVYGEYDEMDILSGELLTVSTESPEAGKYPMEAYNTYIKENIMGTLDSLCILADEDNLYNHINFVKVYYQSAPANLEAFYASMYQFQTLPFTYTTNSGDFAQEMNLGTPVSGIRLTFLTNKGTGAYNGYPLIALRALEIVDKSTGAALELNEELVTTNSLETSEGNMAALFDGDDATFYHSIWANGTMDPVGHVYLDIKFPEGISLQNFIIKTYQREGGGQTHIAPGTVAVTNQGVSMADPLLNRPNTYNVMKLTQVTDPADLKDGGLYLISGNLRANNGEDASKPRFYSGVKPYHADERAAVNDTCVYMFKKAADGWNIISLAHGKYLNAEEGLTALQSEANAFKIAKSGNMENTMVLYNEVPDTTLTVEAWEGAILNEAGDTITEVAVEEGTVTAKYRVYMDWDNSFASRLCVDYLPGEFEYGFDVIGQYPELVNGALANATTSAGDYLHFNKTNGEGEWNIYEVSMDDPYFVWLKAVVPQINALNLVPGVNPGCIAADEQMSKEFNEAKAAAEVAINENRRANAQSVVETLVAGIEKLNGAERVKINPNSDYAFISDFDGFYEISMNERAIYADTETEQVRWTVSPLSFEGDNTKFLFKFVPMDEMMQAQTYITVDAQDVDKTFIIQSVSTGKYIGKRTDDGVKLADFSQVEAYMIESVDADAHTFSKYKGDGAKMLHANNHGGGTGYGSNLVYYNGGANGCSAWRIVLVNETSENSVSDIVVEGDEVVSVSYYTAAGVALPAPVKGINIVVKKYANGVVEAQKVFVK